MRASAIVIFLLLIFILSSCAGVRISAGGRVVKARDSFPIISYELFRSKKLKPNPHPRAIFFYVQGSEYESVLPKVGFLASAVIAGGRAVMVEKRGVYPDSVTLETCYRYADKGTRVNDYLSVLDDYLKNIAPDLPVILVGGSEGGDVAAAVAAKNSRVSHLILIGAGGGWSQKTEFSHMVKEHPGYLGCSDTRELDSILSVIETSRDSLKMWAGHPYKRWQTYMNDSALVYLKTLNIPILLLQGSADVSVPAGSARALDSSMKALGKTNLDYIEYPDVDHAMVNVKDGKSRYPYLEIDMIKWLEKQGLAKDWEARLFINRVKNAHKDIF
jgi:esterase/lipase